jgi:hypothetical protein
MNQRNRARPAMLVKLIELDSPATLPYFFPFSLYFFLPKKYRYRLLCKSRENQDDNHIKRGNIIKNKIKER